jgi:hypothetical protein
MKKTCILFLMLFTISGMASSRPANWPLLPEGFEKKMTVAFDQAGNIQLVDRFIRYSHILFGSFSGDHTSQQLLTTPYNNEMINSLWDNNAWVNQEKEVHVFNSDGLNTEIYSWNWTNNQWIYSSLVEMGYDSQDRPVSMLMKAWDSSQNSWTDLLKITVTYSSGNNPSEWLAQFNIGGVWVNYSRFIFTYNMQGQWTEILNQAYDMVGLTWQDAEKTLYTYDSSGNLSHRLIQEWSGSSWDDLERSLHTFNSSGYETETISEEWVGNWMPYNRATYTYDAQWNRISVLNEWMPVTTWENGVLNTMTYDAQNKLMVELIQMWSGTAWENYEKEEWMYNLPVGIENPGLRHISGLLYPNPAVNHVNISFELEEASSITTYIYDVTGREFYQHSQGQLPRGRHQLVVPVSTLPSGNYIVTLRNGSRNILTERLVVNR